METGAQPQLGSPGAQLLIARTQAGLSAADAAEQLHLDTATVDALESGRFEGLGASVFVRGHLRRYAELVKVPEEQVLAAYDSWAGRLAARPDLSDVITAPAARSGARGFQFRPRAAVIGAVVLVPLALIWWAVRMPSREHSEKAAATIAPSPSATTPAAESVTPPVTAPAQVASTAPPIKTTQSASAAAAPVVQPVKTPAAAAAPMADAADAPTMSLQMNITQASYIEISDANGATLYHGLALAHSRHHVTGVAPLRVFLGNPMGVTLEMQGRAVDLNGNTPATRARRFSLDSSGHIVETHSAAQP